MNQLAKRYAKALFDLALEENLMSTFQPQIKSIHTLFKENEELREFVNSQGVPSEAKKEFFNKLFKENIHIYVIHFLCLLVDKKRERNIEAVCEEFNSLCNEYFNVLEGIVYSTKPLTKDQMTNIEKSIELKLNKKVELTNKLDSSLIGGLKVVVGDTVFDNSIQHKMEALKNELLQGKDVNS